MPNPLRLLLVEDSPEDAELLVRHLQKGGYDVSFERVDSHDAMSAALDRQSWDLIISDHSMPGFSGPEALKLAREKNSDAPFIFVSGTIGEDIAVSALKGGAQDYLMKGHLQRLLPAVERELRERDERWERARMDQRMQQLERFEAIGQLAGGIAHDFNNVIGAVLGWAKLGAEESSSHPAFKSRFQRIHDEAERAARLTAQLLAFARRQVLQPKYMSLNNCIEGMRNLLHTAAGGHITIDTVLAPGLDIIRADPTQIEQIVMNLCLNARDAMPSGGKLRIETRNVVITEDFCRIHSDGVPGNYVLLMVSDTGTGMDTETIARIFEPFFTTKELGRGTGLGLATVYGIVKQHEGFINVHSEVGKGTTFWVYFPASEGKPEQPAAIATGTAPKGTETVLVADDHDGLLAIAEESLTSYGYKVLLATNGPEAVQMFALHHAETQLVILDVTMPLLRGPQAYAQMTDFKPHLPVIFTSGHTAEASQLGPLIKNGAVFMQKPYSPQDLGRTVRRMLDASAAACS